jgi:hypothetical protein
MHGNAEHPVRLSSGLRRHSPPLPSVPEFHQVNPPLAGRARGLSPPVRTFTDPGARITCLRVYQRGCGAGIPGTAASRRRRGGPVVPPLARRPSLVDNSCNLGYWAAGFRQERGPHRREPQMRRSYQQWAAVHRGRSSRRPPVGGHPDSSGDLEWCVRRTRAHGCVAGAVARDRGHVWHVDRRRSVRRTSAGSSRPLRPPVDRSACPPGGPGRGSAGLCDGATASRDLRLREPRDSHPPST